MLFPAALLITRLVIWHIAMDKRKQGTIFGIFESHCDDSIFMFFDKFRCTP